MQPSREPSAGSQAETLSAPLPAARPSPGFRGGLAWGSLSTVSSRAHGAGMPSVQCKLMPRRHRATSLAAAPSHPPCIPSCHHLLLPPAFRLLLLVTPQGQHVQVEVDAGLAALRTGQTLQVAGQWLPLEGGGTDPGGSAAAPAAADGAAAPTGTVFRATSIQVTRPAPAAAATVLAREAGPWGWTPPAEWCLQRAAALACAA